MRPYELTFIVAPDADDQEFNTLVEQIKGWLTESGANVTKTDVWGRRHLAYPIRSFNEGFYVSLNFEMAPDATVQLERNLRLSQKVIRHLLIRADA
ncbi:MAG: 30S ribosomal protein S6 [Anaerolinea sp.]|nr:30S ribosomal protein S6 [Anaerolinea sp.]MCC6973503.1 30S ribosomal protein S6 [Anaerolineae bacterium]CAG0999003.1 30S ribosomal protein S6 [Anaerolineae bacterium]